MAPKLCYASTISWPLDIYMGAHINNFYNKNCDITLIAQSAKETTLAKALSDIEAINIKIERKISIAADILALSRLMFLFKKNKFDCVHSIMAKSGLLCMLAAFLTRVPIRIHTYTGQVWSTKSGLPRFFLKKMDWLIAQFATHLLTDSPSQMNFLISQKIVPQKKINVLGSGSICGVDPSRFKIDQQSRVKIREELNIPPENIVILFVGRLNSEKGVPDLVEAFKNLNTAYENISLLLVGPDEEIFDFMHNKNIYRVQFTRHPESYMAASDLLCLPSLREGFGNVIIESASCAIPAIGSKIYGISDAIIDNVTGIMHEPSNRIDLQRCIERLIKNPDLRHQLGEAARIRAIDKFSQARLVNQLYQFYRQIGLKI
jgi:glycosyltransferase involved in cell wall biosynthesis